MTPSDIASMPVPEEPRVARRLEQPIELPALPIEATAAERLVARMLQIGAVLAVLAATTTITFDLDRFYAPKELVVHLTALACGVLAAFSARRWRFNRVDALLLGYLGLSIASTLLAQNPWLGARATFITLSGFVLFWVARSLADAGLARHVVHALVAMVVVTALMSLVQAYGGELPIFSRNRAPGGSLGNRNSVAHLGAMGLPVVILATLCARNATRLWLGAFAILLITATLVLTRSRAALLGVGAVMAVLLVMAVLAPAVRSNARYLVRFLIILVFAGVGALAAVSLPNALRWNSESPYLDTARGVVNYREGSGRGRLLQYRNTAKMAITHPLLGVGPGNWAVRYPEYASRRDPSMSGRTAGMTTNPWPSSDWVAILSERGLLAATLLALAWFGIAGSAFRRLRSALDSEEGLRSIVLLSVMAGTFMVGMFDAVTLLAWPTFFFWVAVGALWIQEAEPDRVAAVWVRGMLVMLLALGAGAGAARSAGQITAMLAYAKNVNLSTLEQAARLDPGNYRLRVRLAQRVRGRNARCQHAVAALELYPNSAEAKRLARRCE